MQCERVALLAPCSPRPTAVADGHVDAAGQARQPKTAPAKIFPLQTTTTTTTRTKTRTKMQLNSNQPHQLAAKLRQIRLLLFYLAAVLLLVFLAGLALNDPQQPTAQPPSQLPQANSLKLDPQNWSAQEASQVFISSRDDELPTGADRLLLEAASFGGQQDLSRPTIGDDFDADQFQPQWWTLDRRAAYLTATNYIRPTESARTLVPIDGGQVNSITLTTQATVEFVHHSLELCKRWQGQISLAVYCPGEELTVCVTLIKFLRQCLPEPLSECVRTKITWHLVVDAQNSSAAADEQLKAPREYLDVRNFSQFSRHNVCPKTAGPTAEESIKQFEIELRRANKLWPLNYRSQHKLTYPINVLRNTARLAAKTNYLLASDIELYPNVKLAEQFDRFLREKQVEKLVRQNKLKNFVFTLPIFEVNSNSNIPKTKSELVEMFRKNEAIFFHKYVCDVCQKFPNREIWLQRNKLEENSEEVTSDDKELSVFEITQRDKSHDFWEPIFIGTNKEPLYDDELSWDGRRDKMAQMYEMCLEDYKLVVLGNSFLVHAPGVKHFHKDDFEMRHDYIRANNAIYDSSIEKLKKKFANSAQLAKC